MASDIVTATTEAASATEDHNARDAAAPRRLRAARGRFSPLTWRILAINVLALALLGGGLLFLGEYRQSLINTELKLLKTQAQVFAAALGEGATTDALGNGEQLITQLARDMMRRLVEPTRTRAELFDEKGNLIADTSVLGSSSSVVEIDTLPPPDNGNLFERGLSESYDWVTAHLPWSERHAAPLSIGRSIVDEPLARSAFAGDVTATTRGAGRHLTLIAAAPVQYYKEVLGIVVLSTDGRDIEQTVRSVRLAIIKLFGVALGLTVLLSFYLAGTIARPVRRLAAAAERVRRGHGREIAIPDFTARGDEIGDLSGALRDMTGTLWQRMDAIEHFAADVAHEIKNPLTSLRSAVETAARVDDPDKQRRLLAVVIEDVQRLDRLITDISDASRLDAELSRDETAIVPLDRMLAALVDLYRDKIAPDGPRLILDLPGAAGDAGSELLVSGIESRLVRVFRNLLDNAISFSPRGGVIAVRARRRGGMVRIVVEDEGPGIPPAKLEAIFDRFYSERPAGEAFGTHSGLGLAISKQVIEAHHGSIRAENRQDRDGVPFGARFIVELPAEEA